MQGELEKTNDAYALAKIAGIKLCENYLKQKKINDFVLTNGDTIFNIDLKNFLNEFKKLDDRHSVDIVRR